ncbi:efflux RND transporter periplasmic adaptor subunit [Marinobacter sp. M3C]|uniref:efflux RND transporter periplasmic adaptor subunit n=1 Tax=Marinobacter sp. M3C TaxID=2917715 RepID=UPI002010B674|nr:efflux RND transporter periplasmic adaptor subunit [Marinobacter sp. M3C]UQG59252.1 efflux RND transporter periplasmic adaptor subunit [Marinobacter sp. M3C]
MVRPYLRMALLVVAALTAVACSKSSDDSVAANNAAASGPAVVHVRTAAVEGGDAREVSLRFAGIVRASQRATLTFQLSGTLTERKVELGQTVKAGAVLARIYSPALEPARDSAIARLDELITNYEQAEREWQRARSLSERGVVSEQSLEQIAARRDGLKAGVATARASLAEASKMLEENTLKAPFAGRVEALLVEQDEFVAAGQPVMRLSSPKGREVEVRVPVYMLNHVSLGAELPVWSVQDRSQAPVQGSVVEIAQAGAIRGELQPLLVNLPANTLNAGVPVEVGITPQTIAALTVPLLAVIRDVNATASSTFSPQASSSSSTSVFLVRDGVARRTPVTVLRILGERVAISAEGLVAGDQVVYAGMTKLADGDTVIEVAHAVRTQPVEG